MPISINEFIYHLKQRIAPRFGSGRGIAIEELSQEEIRDLARVSAEIRLALEKQKLQVLLHRRFIL